MPDTPKRYYWDANVFLSFIEGHPERVGNIDALLNDAAAGKIEIITSTVSIVEVAFAKQERDQRALSDEAAARIGKLWLAPSPVKLAEFHEIIAARAREMIRQAMILELSLKPMDAIHLATASLLAVDEFHTYEDRMSRFEGVASLRIVRPAPEQIPIRFDEEAEPGPDEPPPQ